MFSQSRRLPLQRQINEAAVSRAIEIFSAKGLGLPCTITKVSDQLVTVQCNVLNMTFPEIQVPIAEPLYSRAPYQKGDRGVLISVDAALGEVSGQIKTLPPFQGTGNLGSAFFFPISSVKWGANPDTTMYLLQGPNGFLIRSLDGTVFVKGDKRTALTLGIGSTVSIELTQEGITFNGNTTINGTLTTNGLSGGQGNTTINGNVTVTGTTHSDGNISSDSDVTAGTISLKNHLTTGVEPGGGVSGPPEEGT